jgi:hypothetical protein
LEQTMNRDDPFLESALVADGRMLVHWMIGRESIWIQIAPDGALTVNGEPVTSAVPRAGRGTRIPAVRTGADATCVAVRPALQRVRLVESAT